MKKNKRAKAKGLYRDGHRLVIREGARFPGRCAICNKPCEGKPVEFTFERDTLGYIELNAAQALARAAGDFVTGAKYTGPVRTEISLCSWHRSRRLRLLGIGVGMTVLAVGFLLIQYAMGVVIVPPGELGFLFISLHNFIAFGAVLVGIIITMMCVFDSSKLWFKAAKYYDRFVWVTAPGGRSWPSCPRSKTTITTLGPRIRTSAPTS